jgi:hypothetical protein
VRRQRPHDTALKISSVPTRYQNLTSDFEFAGYHVLFSADSRWGSLIYLDLTEQDIAEAQKELDTPRAKLGQWVSLMRISLTEACYGCCRK